MGGPTYGGCQQDYEISPATRGVWRIPTTKKQASKPAKQAKPRYKKKLVPVLKRKIEKWRLEKSNGGWSRATLQRLYIGKKEFSLWTRNPPNWHPTHSKNPTHRRVYVTITGAKKKRKYFSGGSILKKLTDMKKRKEKIIIPDLSGYLDLFTDRIASLSERRNKYPQYTSLPSN